MSDLGFHESEVPAPAPRRWDLLLAGLALVVLVVSALSFLVIGLSYGLVSLACADADAANACDTAALTTGTRLAAFGPPAVALVTVVVAIARLARRRSALWIAVGGVVVSVILFAIGTALVDGAAPGGTLF